ncbi:uncharacterized protein TM35_000352300 [Trypanosoma theileri]|uniref:Uncharacterized protein n=1 Tax=Trypanosoma theileri TaxID=67003 RepID=A0A1X0NLA7_9TRYP|nr:uncharacterized protein TM35_000352300 [Trypanosoma theileri]ORC85486.1 hypothetical protein TM35_000352300 [Trypanosoma theileri]
MDEMSVKLHRKQFTLSDTHTNTQSTRIRDSCYQGKAICMYTVFNSKYAAWVSIQCHCTVVYFPHSVILQDKGHLMHNELCSIQYQYSISSEEDSFIHHNADIKYMFMFGWSQSACNTTLH